VTTADVQPLREPKYYTVKRHLLARIATLSPGSTVATERELASDLSTSRTTVRQALVELVAEGRLVRRQGAGTFVAEPKMTWPLAARFPQLTRHIRRQQSLYTVLREIYGVVPVSAEELIATAPASPREAALLGADPGAPMLVLGRHSRVASGAPVEWVTSWYRGDRITFVANLATPR
jgi:DNA-binding GntR family transcriptional regulator